MPTSTSYHSTVPTVNPSPASTGPSTCQQRATAGPFAIALYKRWDNAGGGYFIITQANGAEVARHFSNYYPGAQARFDAELRRREAETTAAMATMLAFVDEPCSCIDLPDGRARVCASCRRQWTRSNTIF